MSELKSVEERLLDRTLYLIGKHGSVNVPVRTIVKEADVNIGAINYYFGTKENMLRQVKKFYIENLISTVVPLDDESLEDEEKLKRYASLSMEYSMRFPGVIALLKDAFETKEQDEMSQKIVEETMLMEEKLNRVMKRYLKDVEDEYSIRKTIFLSSIIYPTLEFNELNGTAFLIDEKKRMDYIDKVVKLIRQGV
ncbi:TetR/AcrR family transcriptional regulator [Proteiniclasticum sp. SCR006]|uniref:TetR/AcrR family transcriptional regulator n=1 Tax=Proteiniclasticum aestuarii TaxID=2817862 RepID=A0A939KG42_9CLOT|nr:TetR/AcrR family transcriptional regulator [Proteiniclasticum aestuarii]MBO1263984.1 TetR/AcrR family transcriptional regulator [Proteiniclasticum aestuarii]